jgi:hypothetical protein
VLIFCVLFVYLFLLFCSYFYCTVCTSVGLLPSGEIPIAAAAAAAAAVVIIIIIIYNYVYSFWCAFRFNFSLKSNLVLITFSCFVLDLAFVLFLLSSHFRG